MYNWALDYDTRQYAETKRHLSWMSLASCEDYKKLKADNQWLYEVGATTLQNSIAHLGKAFQMFFRRKGGFPRHKSKYDSRQSFEVPAGLKLDFRHGKIQIPKFIHRKGEDNRIRCVFSRKVKRWKLGTATVSRNACGQYFVSFIVHTVEAEPVPIPETALSPSNTVGIDFGLKHFLTFDDGSVVDSPEFFKRALEKLAREQRRLSRKQKGSRNREKQRIKVATCHNHVVNQRTNFLHVLSTRLADDSQVMAVCVEDLNLKGMARNWGRKVSDLSYRTFMSMLEYKLRRRGKRLIRTGRFEPSSQTCSCCGHRQKMPLEERTYRCTECGAVVDRDVNAAKNVKAFALTDIIKNLSTDATSGTNACGVGGSGRQRASADGETADGEAGKSGGFAPQSQRSSAAE